MYIFMFVTARAFALIHLYRTSLAHAWTISDDGMMDMVQTDDDRMGISQSSSLKYRDTIGRRKLYSIASASRGLFPTTRLLQSRPFCLELKARAPVIQDECACGWQTCKKSETCNAETDQCIKARSYAAITIVVGLILMFLLLCLPVSLEISQYYESQKKNREKSKDDSKSESRHHNNEEDTDDEGDSDDDIVTKDEPTDPEEIAILSASFSAHKVNKMEKSLQGNFENDSPVNLKKVKRSSHRTPTIDNSECVAGDHREKRRRKKKKKKSPWATGNVVDANGDAEYNDYRTVVFHRRKPPPRGIVFTGNSILKTSDCSSPGQKKKKVHWQKNLETPDRPLPPPPYYIPSAAKPAANNSGDAAAAQASKPEKANKEKKSPNNSPLRRSYQGDQKKEPVKNSAAEKKSESRTVDRKPPEKPSEKKDMQSPRQVIRGGTGPPIALNIPPL